MSAPALAGVTGPVSRQTRPAELLDLASCTVMTAGHLVMFSLEVLAAAALPRPFEIEPDTSMT